MPVRATLYLPTHNKPVYPDHSGLLMISVPIGEVNQCKIYQFRTGVLRVRILLANSGLSRGKFGLHASKIFGRFWLLR